MLDGRRRFDLRVTVILDPALALICWAHYAPPISDMFRKSYRKLLRWNDEFPFAKFSVGEDERPLLAVELPDRRWPTPTRLGLALARILGIADRLLDESTGWLWIGGRMPDQSGRTHAQRGASSPGTRPSCRSCLDRGPERRRDRRRRPSPVARWLVARRDRACSARAVGVGPVAPPRSAPPRRTSRSSASARYDVQPTTAPRPRDRST